MSNFLIALGVAALMVFVVVLDVALILLMAYVGIWAANTIAGETLVALTSNKVFAVAAAIWIVRLVFSSGGKS